MRRSILRVSLTAVGVAVFAAGVASAQNPAPAARPRADSLPAVTPAQLQNVVPMFSQMMAAMMQGMLAILERPETAEQLATFDRNYLDALQRHGFSRDEALRIVVGVGLPIPGAPR
jgi:hypothetical protein